MKRIIDGKMYDTEEAAFIGEWHFGNGRNYTCEKLYQQKDGDFFIAGYGGPDSEYGKRIGWTCIDGVKISPISHDKARNFTQYHIPEKYDAYFGICPLHEIVDETGERWGIGSWGQIKKFWNTIKENPEKGKRFTLWTETPDRRHQVEEEVTGDGYTEYDRDTLEEIADYLYDNGWEQTDREELKYQYNFTDNELDILCEYIEKFKEEVEG